MEENDIEPKSDKIDQFQSTGTHSKVYLDYLHDRDE